MKNEMDSDRYSGNKIREWLPPPVPTRDTARTNTNMNTGINLKDVDMEWLSLSEQKDLINGNNILSSNTVSTNANTSRSNGSHSHDDYRKHQITYKKGLIHLNRQIALWHTKFAQEILNREKQMSSFQNEWIYNRLNEAISKFLKHDMNPFSENPMTNHQDDPLLLLVQYDDNTTMPSDYVTLQQRMGPLQSRIQQVQDQLSLQQSSHLTLLQNMKNELNDITDDLDSKLYSFHMLSRKREEQMYATLYHYASLAETALAETTARRYAQLNQLEAKIQQYTNPKSSHLFLEEIQHLKDILKEEIQERIRRDKEIIDRIMINTELVEKLLAMCLDVS